MRSRTRMPAGLRPLLLRFGVVGAILLLPACALYERWYGERQAGVDETLLLNLPATPIDYRQSVRPILERRCVVCHGCYDAPCQLKLSSMDGLQRGASKQRVYDGARITGDQPTRLGIDAQTPAQWRDKGFFPVLAETADTPRERLQDSVMYQLLRLKQRFPQPRDGQLPETFDLGLDREQVCTARDEFEGYAREHPHWGMPYAMPNLSEDEYSTLARWLAQGAPAAPPAAQSAGTARQVADWEAFFNGQSLKQQLVSRYLYEHLFIGHLHLADAPQHEFFRLVRSTTPPGVAIDEIPTIRPYDDPGTPNFYYRLRPYEASIVAKNHVTYELSPAKMALSVIQDQFWVLFLDPDGNLITLDADFLARESSELEMPNERGDTLRLFAAWSKYWQQLTKYMDARQDHFRNMRKRSLDEAMAFIWDGNGDNPNAALTVFRHFDSASVEYGLLGNYPETAWIIDYPVFERIHYLLVAGFNVYGNVGHQLNTRLYMDFLRMESENNFLAFLPVRDRKRIRDSWYEGLRAGLDQLLDEPSEWLKVEVVTGYRSDDSQRELYQAIETRLGAMAGGPDYINRCPSSPCRLPDEAGSEQNADRIMARVAAIRGPALDVVPEVAFLRVRRSATSQPDLAYTLIHNKAYHNISSIFTDTGDDDQRDRDNDTLTVLKGLHGAYPNFFFDIELRDIDEFTRRYDGVHTSEDRDRFAVRYGIRRTNPDFWPTADWFQDRYGATQPESAGILDLNRYRND
jgi:Fatty acid cis/trans isomerase (CTI)